MQVRVRRSARPMDERRSEQTARVDEPPAPPDERRMALEIAERSFDGGIVRLTHDAADLVRTEGVQDTHRFRCGEDAVDGGDRNPLVARIERLSARRVESFECGGETRLIDNRVIDRKVFRERSLPSPVGFDKTVRVRSAGERCHQVVRAVRAVEASQPQHVVTVRTGFAFRPTATATRSSWVDL